jgi:hypothetical protein
MRLGLRNFSVVSTPFREFFRFEGEWGYPDGMTTAAPAFAG